MIAVVTGAAGFIGSHLCQRLLKENWEVVGIDCFADFYPRWIKEKNISALLKENNFELLTSNLNQLDLKKILKNKDIIFHLAAQAGVRSSWGQNFTVYTENNIEATQKLLEAAKETPIKKFIYASSSSVYGFCPHLPMTEDSPLFPYSPYGVTKLAAENLCSLYYSNYGIPALSLRLFTVFGPRQRPDMAFHKFLKAGVTNNHITVFGDGQQTRDFTFVTDVIDAFMSALEKGKAGEIYNIGGGQRIKLVDVLPLIEKTCQKKINISWQKEQKGDVRHTWADIEKAGRDLDYSPQVSLLDGLKEEWIWLQKLYQ